MKKTKKRALYILAALIGALFVLSCLVGFAACGGSDDPTETPETPAAATVSSVSIAPVDGLSLYEGGTGTLTATVTMSDGSDYDGTYTWSSNATSVATVTGNGASATVTAVGEGNATVTVAVSDNKSASCTVTVTALAPASVALSAETLNLDMSEGSTTTSGTLTATVTMNDGSTSSSETVTWQSSDESVATVEGGTVTAAAVGIATITATAGDASASCTVYVAGPAKLELAAKDAALLNAKSSGTSADSLMSVDASTGTVSNITASDEVVFEVVASAAATGVSVTVNVPSGASASDLELYLNGATEAASLTNGAGTISLVAGANTITLKAASTAASGASLDGIDLAWKQDTVETSGTLTKTSSMGPTIAAGGAAGSVIEVSNTGKATLEATDATLIDATGSSGSTSLLDTETTTNRTGKAAEDDADFSLSFGDGQNVKNFNVAGDAIVYQVNATEAISGATLTVTAGGAELSSLNIADYTASSASGSSSHQILSVNGQTAALNGTVYGGGTLAYSKSWGTLTASGINLIKGINYIVITCDGTGVNVGEVELEWVSATVSNTNDLTTALQSSNVIQLSESSSISGNFTVAANADVTIDLNGQTVSDATTSSSGTNDTITVAEGATLTIRDSSTDEKGAIENTYATHASNDNAAAIEVNGGSLVIESGTIESSSVGVRALSGSVTIDGGTVYSSAYYALWESEGKVDVVINDGIVGGSYAGILVDGDSNFGYDGYQTGAVTTLTVNGGVVYSGGEGQAAIRTESMTSKDSAIITINGGLVYGAKAAPGIFLGNGTLAITDGIIAGSTAVEVQAGDVTISGGTFVATDNNDQSIDITTSSSASFTNGYALAIYPRGYISRCKNDSTFSMALDVTISGGTFIGDVYAAEKSVHTGTNVGEWTINTADSNGVTNYKVDWTNAGITLTASQVEVITGYTGEDEAKQATTTSLGCYLYTYTDLTSNFVTGTRSDNSTIPDEAYTVGGVKFDGSAVTSVERVGTTYIVNGTYGTMTQEQAKAFYGGDAEAAVGHEGDKYIMILITADEDNPYTIVSDAYPEGLYMDGVTNDGYFLCFNVTNAAEGEWCFTIVVDGVSFDVVLGDFTQATAS